MKTTCHQRLSVFVQNSYWYLLLSFTGFIFYILSLLISRKLKNRVAAQSARDRKKALMQDLEEKVAKLDEEMKLLKKENAELRICTGSLRKENQMLKECLNHYTSTSSTTNTPPSPASIPTGQTTCVKVEVLEPSSAVSRKTDLVSGSAAPAVSLPKEQIQVLSRVMMQYAACALTLR